MAVAVLTLLVTAGGVFGATRLLTVARNHHKAADTAADLKFDLSELSSLSDDYTLTPSSSSLRAAVADAEQRVTNDLSSLKRSGVEPADMVAVATEVRSFMANVKLQRQLGERGQAQPAAVLATTIDANFSDLGGKVDTELGDMRGAADRYTVEVELLGFGGGLLVLAAVAGAVAWDGRRRRWAERDRAERRNRARFEAMVEHGSDLLVVTYPAGTDTYVSPALQHLLGYPPDSTAARDLGEIVDPAERPRIAGLLEQARATGRAGPSDCRVRHADGSWRIMEVTLVDMAEVAEVAGVLWSARDVTDRRKLEEQLEHSAFSDSLTGLANRVLFRERLDHAVARRSRDDHPMAVLFADLDGFKSVNESLGHDAGDDVLVEVAARLAGCLRPGDTLARLGGDEFAIILEDGAEPVVAEHVADRMLEIMHQPFTVSGTEIRVGVSIGIAHAGAETGAEMLRNADVAMYSAKSNRRGQWTVFEPIMQQRAEDRLRLSIDLDGAVEGGQLEVHYQPTVAISSGEIRGAEALVRWRHPTRGLILPSVFVPIAEETGEIVAIGRWVLREACRQAHFWHEQFPSAPPLRISVNLSGCQLADDGLVADVRTILADTAIDPDTVVLEITESVVMHDVDAIKAKLQQLKDLGVGLAIDDFGTGYSSLAYLRQFPVDILKIDRAFVEAATSGAAGGQALVRAIIEMGASLHLAMIAEGIERQDQADLMLALGCPTGQGFLYARPMLPGQLGPLIAARRSAELETAR